MNITRFFAGDGIMCVITWFDIKKGKKVKVRLEENESEFDFVLIKRDTDGFHKKLIQLFRCFKMH